MAQKSHSRAPWQQKVIQVLPVIGLAAFILILIYTRHSGMFRSVADLQHFIKNFGNFAIIAFIVV